MALAMVLNYSSNESLIPEFKEYLGDVTFASSPNSNVHFERIQVDCFNQGVFDGNGAYKPMQFNMHIDDNLYAKVGIEWIHWAMHCSIQALNIIMGGPNPDLYQIPPTLISSFAKQSAIAIDSWVTSLTPVS
jgi:hypothetical protein